MSRVATTLAIVLGLVAGGCAQILDLPDPDDIVVEQTRANHQLAIERRPADQVGRLLVAFAAAVGDADAVPIVAVEQVDGDIASAVELSLAGTPLRLDILDGRAVPAAQVTGALVPAMAAAIRRADRVITATELGEDPVFAPLLVPDVVLADGRPGLSFALF